MPIQPQRDISLAQYTTFQLGGRSRYFFEATSDDEVAQAVAWSTDAKLELYILGGGSNLVVADSGVSGLVLKIATSGISEEDLGYRASAGVPWDDLVLYAVDRDLAGIECLSGIPGFVGATPIQNVGAYGQEIAQTLTRVTVLDRTTMNRLTLTRDQCRLSYRDSRFKSSEPNRYVVLNVEFELFRVRPRPTRHRELKARLSAHGLENPTVQDVRRAVIELRQSKTLVIGATSDPQRSAGSFFVNPVVDAEVAQALLAREGPAMPVFPEANGKAKLSAAWLIEHAGWKRGTRDGNVGLSIQHCLVLVAHERAEAQDIVRLAQRIRAAVFERFNVELRPEPSFWGFDDFDRGLPNLDEDAPPTLGSASWPTRSANN